MWPIELSRAPLFQSLSPAARTTVAAAARDRRYGRGDRLFRAGDPAAGVVVLLDGIVRLFRVAADGTETTVAIVGPGGLLGFAGLAGEHAHHDDAEALTDAHVLGLSAAALAALVAREPTVLAHLAGGLVARLEAGCADAATDAELDLRRRLLRLLRRLARPEPAAWGAGPVLGRLPKRLPHAELARLLGAERAAVTRALQQLEAEGLIERRRGHVVRVAVAAPGGRGGT